MRVRKLLIILVLSIKSIVYITLLIIILNNFIQANDPHLITKREIVNRLERQIPLVRHDEESYIDDWGDIHVKTLAGRESILEILRNMRPRRFALGQRRRFTVHVMGIQICFMYSGAIFVNGHYYTIADNDHEKVREFYEYYVSPLR